MSDCLGCRGCQIICENVLFNSGVFQHTKHHISRPWGAVQHRTDSPQTPQNPAGSEPRPKLLQLLAMTSNERMRRRDGRDVMSERHEADRISQNNSTHRAPKTRRVYGTVRQSTG